jgi:heme/copper-type cytochrome/quinol oxidase subunit 1
MRTVKLFAIAAVGFISLAFFLKDSPLDLYIHDNYFVLSRSMVTVLAAVICALFVLVYFSCERWLRIPLNRGLSLANFVLIVLPLAVLIWSLHAPAVTFRTANDSRQLTFMLLYLVAPLICFLLGCLLFVVNFGWSLTRLLRAHR